MTDAPHAVDLGLSLPLHGVQLLEASAGTGKTTTIATLYARLVIVERLPVAQLLAVTFTEAATRELREAVRARLAQARDLLEAGAIDDADDDSAAARRIKTLLRAALAAEPLPALRARVRRAAEQLDLAPIFTIHGFCQRALADHALESGQPLAAREVVANEAALRHEVAVAFWRGRSRTQAGADALLAAWKSPAQLADALRDLLVFDALVPAPQADAAAQVDAANDALRAARGRLADAFVREGDAARAQLALGAVNKNYSKDSAVDAVWQALRDWHADPLERDPDTDKLGNYGTAFLVEKTKKGERAPISPLFDAIEAWEAARAAADAACELAGIAIVHDAVAFARERLARLKRERGLIGYDDMIGLVAGALDDDVDGRFAERLQAQYRVALVDEFQDTDPRQWRIFRRLFAPGLGDLFEPGAPRALLLIGDPKQAIYRFRGGDVATYLAARTHAGAPHALRRNFRSRPRALAAVEALFTLRGPGAFAQDGIEFEPVQAGGGCGDDALRIDGADAPGLWLQALAPDAVSDMEGARTAATNACVAAIAQLLAQADAGRARLRDRHGIERVLAPGDLTVLVPRNEDAEAVRHGLAAAGIASVAAGRRSLYATDEARHVAWLLAALAAPADDGRLRAALATPLFGLDAAALAGFDTDVAAHQAWQDRLPDWQWRLRRHGPVALLGALCAEQAPRLRTWPDGARRLSNYLQLAEDLQGASAVAHGPAALRVELERRIADQDSRNDAELLRLDADAARVRILTLHASKGLTLDVVFLPFAGMRKGDGGTRAPPHARTSDGEIRTAHLYPAKDGDACLEEEREDRAEQVRLLYVGLTRARLATWVAWGAIKDAQRSPLGWLLHRDGAGVPKLDAALVGEGLAALRAHAGDSVAVLPARAADASVAPAHRAAAPVALPPPRPIRRVLEGDWSVLSFSQLARDPDLAAPRGAEDELDTGPPERSRFAGPRFGNALHAALEHVDFGAWRDWRDEVPPPGQYAPLADALRGCGFATVADLDEGVRVCIEAREQCRAFEVNHVSTQQKRKGNAALDIVRVYRETHTAGWRFTALILMKDGVVVYKLTGGQPLIHQIEAKRDNLAPLQALSARYLNADSISSLASSFGRKDEAPAPAPSEPVTAFGARR